MSVENGASSRPVAERYDVSVASVFCWFRYEKKKDFRKKIAARAKVDMDVATGKATNPTTDESACIYFKIYGYCRGVV